MIETSAAARAAAAIQTDATWVRRMGVPPGAPSDRTAWRSDIATVAAYRDPWQDGREPVTEGQFRTSLPLLPLPQVPVR